jgi:DNA-binding NarL/FixJ family response regulator
MTGEREVLCLVADGMTSKEIGDTLFVPEHAVRNRLTQLVVGPGFSHPTQAAAFSVTHHLCTGAWGLYRVV